MQQYPFKKSHQKALGFFFQREPAVVDDSDLLISTLRIKVKEAAPISL